MNDHEHFARQMNDTLVVLRNAIDTLDVPIKHKDKILGPVRNQREFAYKAGKAEDSGRRENHEEA